MRSLLRRFVLTALIAPAAGAAMIASPAEAAPASTPDRAQTQAEITRLTNVQRTARGCAAVTVDARLTAAAVAHSTWMVQTGTFSHTGRAGSSFATRVRAAGHARPSSENIAWGHRTPAELVSAWMKSPGHRANILDCRSTAVGIGVAHTATGTPYYTQDFGF